MSLRSRSSIQNDQPPLTEYLVLAVPPPASVPMFSPQQFVNIPPPVSISNLPGFQQQQQSAPLAQNDSGTFSSIFGTAPAPAAAQAQPQNILQQAQPDQSYPNVSFSQSTAPEYAQAGLQTYVTYPQQLLQGTAVTTPISLPGMPPITVSATIPPQQYTPFTHPSDQQTSN